MDNGLWYIFLYIPTTCWKCFGWHDELLRLFKISSRTAVPMNFCDKVSIWMEYFCPVIKIVSQLIYLVRGLLLYSGKLSTEYFTLLLKYLSTASNKRVNNILSRRLEIILLFIFPAASLSNSYRFLPETNRQLK